ncbi:contact-dependent growth inhibition system immunity protein [Polaribacter cellanae]|uniref:CdiI family contact-dependent growth inhibition immunity protein n=1 Tax=Polaribacter cellanae TaxID=2818493 RepID=A0A975H5M2_9FLAO|nr:contact-dependent growth inhibition system immunity protein [Polaribacter cellanae]QTE21029.1 CdiI family contact-dependent growth inhibition immunity protein [Polaribacter cellanae]
MKEIKSANILKFKDGKTVVYPLRTIKDSGSYAIPPFIVDYNITFLELAEVLKKSLNYSEIGIQPPRDSELFFHKDNVKVTGIKNVKDLHKDSMNISTYIRDNYIHITPSDNQGTRKGFRYDYDGRISIPITSTLEKLAEALEQAFVKSK